MERAARKYDLFNIYGEHFKGMVLIFEERLYEVRIHSLYYISRWRSTCRSFGEVKKRGQQPKLSHVLLWTGLAAKLILARVRILLDFWTKC